MEDVAVMDDIFRPFQPHFPCFLRALLALACNKIVIGDGLGANEAFFEIGVNNAGGFGGFGGFGGGDSGGGGASSDW